MKINGIPVKTTDLSGNLKVITLPKPAGKDEKTANENLYTILRMKCGGAKTDILDELERQRIPNGTSLVFTYDSYTHLIPRYCECTW